MSFELISQVQMLQIAGYAVPKGTEIAVSIWCMHHNEQWWQDAEAFKPERWLGNPTGGDKTGGLAYMPFGMGPRMCIGYKLARKHALHSEIDVGAHC